MISGGLNLELSLVRGAEGPSVPGSGFPVSILMLV